MGKNDRPRFPITVPAVWIVPRTEGCGVQSLISSVVAGVTPVRPTMNNSITAPVANQVARVVVPALWTDAEATSDGNGATR